MVDQNVVDRFFAKVNKHSYCWEWTATRKATGYGRFRYGSRIVSAHRMAALIEGLIEFIDDPRCVLHRCDNPRCVNPVHLFIGTQLENIKDRDAKGRTKVPGLSGERHGNAKLTDAQVAEIKTRYLLEDITQALLAIEFDVKPNTISRIINGKRRGKG